MTRLRIAMAALLCAAVAGVAYAAIPSGGGQINACYKKSGGALRVVDNQGSLNVLGSFPADPGGGSGGPPTNPSDFQGWALYADNPNLSGGTATAIVYAVCATVQ